MAALAIAATFVQKILDYTVAAALAIAPTLVQIVQKILDYTVAAALAIAPTFVQKILDYTVDPIVQKILDYTVDPIVRQFGYVFCYNRNIETLRIADTSGGFESRKSLMREIMESLQDAKIRMIGICGMGGIGKTTMVDEVKEWARKEGLFDEIVKVTVSQKPDLIKIQQDIAEQLHLILAEQSLEARASRLCNKLNGEKRILLIFDDIWTILDFKELGIIPLEGESKITKIMLTSRIIDACEGMEPKKIFEIQFLSPEEAWVLFQQTAGSPVYEQIARDIVKECGGLPIAITSIASALKNKIKDSWEDALQRLRKANPEGPLSVAYTTLMLSYGFLESREIRAFFLLCCLFPEDFEIPVEDLVRYGMGLRLFPMVDNMLEARNRANAYVDKLRNSNLLLPGKMTSFVKLHDIVRDFSLIVASKSDLFLRGKLTECNKMHDLVRDHAKTIATKDDHVFMVSYVDGLKEWPMEDTYEHYTSMSLQCDEMDKLPDGQAFSKLKLLRLLKGSVKLKFPESFFAGMKELKVLAFSGMCIPSPLESLQCLTNLRTLSLDFCKLKSGLSILRNLERLEILRFAGSDLEELPREIKDLTRLRSLDLRICEKLKTITPGILDRLTCLEELYMGGTPFRWAGTVRWAGTDDEDAQNNASFGELRSLSKLVSAEILIPDDVLPTDIQKLERFNLRNGPWKRSQSRNQFTKNTIHLGGSEWFSLSGIQVLFGTTTDLELFSVKGLKNLDSKSEREDLLNLKHLKLWSCHEMEYVVDTVGRHPVGVFPRLESLFLNWMDNLKRICNVGQQSNAVQVSTCPPQLASSFGNLRSIDVGFCKKLESIFSQSIARGLVKLEKLHIIRCFMMDEIFSEDRGEDEKGAVGKIIEFPNLTSIELWELPNLVGFCKGVDTVKLPQLLNLDLRFLNKLTVVYPEMKFLASSEHDQASTDANQPICNHRVTSTCMPKLKNLLVERCDLVEVVFDLQGSSIIEGCLVATQLTWLFLNRLPKLTHVWKKGRHIFEDFQNLSIIEVEDCESLRHLFTPSIAKSLVELRSLYVRRCNLLDAIVEKEDCGEEEEEEECTILFRRLNKMILEALPNLLTFAPKAYTFSGSLEKVIISNCDKLVTSTCMPKLEHLVVRACHMVEVVFDLQGSSIIEGCPVAAQLIRLDLDSLPKLTHVWKKGRHIFQGFRNLSVIEVKNCGSLRHLLTPSIAKSLVELRSLDVQRCNVLEAIVEKEDCGEEEEEEEEEEECTILFPRLNELIRAALPNLLKRICNVGQQSNEIQASMCPSQLASSFGNLISIRVSCCEKLESIFSLSTTRGLVKLEKLEIWGCEMMEEIFFKDRGEDEKVAACKIIEFPNLTSIDLSNVPNLVGFCKGVDAVELPQLLSLNLRFLKKLTVVYPEMKFLASSEHDQASTDANQPLCNQRVTSTCMPKLEQLTVKNCDLVEVVFDLQGSSIIEGRPVAAQLTRLFLEGLPKLTHVWKKGRHIFQRFQNLSVIEVQKCESLRHLFTPSIAKSLVELRTLDVQRCNLLDAIVEKEDCGEEEEVCTILFPKLNQLDLIELPNLLIIAPKAYTFNKKSLKVTISNCGKLTETFANVESGNIEK